MKSIFLILIFFIVEIFFLSGDLKFKDSQEVKINNIKVEFLNSKSYFILPTSIDKTLITDKIQQGSGFKKFLKPVLTFYDDNLTKTIVCNNAFLDEKTNILTLNKDINIAYNGYILKSPKIFYNIKEQTITDSEKFILNGTNINAKGEHLYFDVKESIIKAKNIHYTITTNED